MSYPTIEHPHDVFGHVVLDGHHYYDVSLILQQHSCGGDSETFLPVLRDAQGLVIWRGELTGSCLEGLHQLDELLDALTYAARESNVGALGIEPPGRRSRGSG